MPPHVQPQRVNINRRPGIQTQIRDPFLLQSSERWERREASIRAEWNATHNYDDARNLLAVLHVWTASERERVLNRVSDNLRQDAIHTFWDMLDAEIMATQLADSLSQMAAYHRSRATLHHNQAFALVDRLLYLGVHDTITEITTGTGSPDDPIDADQYFTASAEEDLPALEELPQDDEHSQDQPDLSGNVSAETEDHRYHRTGRRCRRPICSDSEHERCEPCTHARNWQIAEWQRAAREVYRQVDSDYSGRS